MKVIIRVLAGASLLGAIGWFYFQPDWEPGLALVAALSALLASFVVEKPKTPPARQQQNVSDNGVGIQAGGNVSVGDIGQPKKEVPDVR